MCFCVSLDHFIPFVVLGIVSSVPNQEIGWENRLQMTYSVLSGAENLIWLIDLIEQINQSMPKSS